MIISTVWPFMFAVSNVIISTVCSFMCCSEQCADLTVCPFICCSEQCEDFNCVPVYVCSEQCDNDRSFLGTGRIVHVCGCHRQTGLGPTLQGPTGKERPGKSYTARNNL